jgi:hypothetical protein
MRVKAQTKAQPKAIAFAALGVRVANIRSLFDGWSHLIDGWSPLNDA